MQFDDVLEILQAEGQLRRKRTRVLHWILAALVGVQAAIFGYMVATGKDSLSNLVVSFAPMLCLLGLAAGMTPRAKSALLAASTERDPRLVGHLVEALTSGDPEVVKAAKDCLIEILPTLRDDAEPLDQVQHAALVHGLATADERFASAVVRSLRVLGRSESIAVLEAIAHGKSTFVSRASTERLPALALESLGDLRMRLARDVIQRRIAALDEQRTLVR
ncbi:MAG: hypothetical protein IT363_12100 [Methanoregulaceae archaeon]|nr:hypothetical protein [Methanoregulaceae archaeon]